MPQWLLLPLFYLVSIASTTTSNIDPSRSAVVALLPRHLVAFYPLLSDSRDYAPDGCVNGYSQDVLSTRRSTTGSTSTNNVAITQNLGLRLEQGMGLDLPLNVNSCNFRQLTNCESQLVAGSRQAKPWPSLKGRRHKDQIIWCLLSQNGSSVGRSVCVDRGTWVVGGREVRGVEVNLDQWSFVAAVFDDVLTKFYVDGEMVEVDIVVKSVASQLLVVGAAEDQLITGFSGHLKSVFVFDVALSETELTYLMTTKDVAPKEPEDLAPVAAPAVDPVPKLEPIPHFYLKDRLDNVVSARQVIDPDGDEYNAALPTIDDTELLSVKLVYADDIAAESSKTVVNVSTTPFKLWSVEPKLREVHVGFKVTVQGSSKFDSRLSACRINGDVVFGPQKVTANSMTCEIPDLRIQGTTMEFFISQNGIDFVSVGSFTLRNRPQVYRLSPGQILRSISPQVIDIFGMNFVDLTTLSCSVGGIPSHAVFLSPSRIQCVVESMRYGQDLDSVAVHVSINGVDYSEDPSDLTFINLPAFSGLSPNNGPVSGGTTVTLSGQGFREDTRYAILYQPNMLKDVTFVSENLLLWTTSPVNATGSKDLKLAVEGILFPEVPSLQFSFTMAPQPTSVFPRLLPIQSETVLTISGTGFGHFNGLRCAFVRIGADSHKADAEKRIRPAIFVAKSIIQCSTPRFDNIRTYGIVVSNNAQDYSQQLDAVNITVHGDIILEDASVLSGPATGETVVNITGKNFVTSSDVACKFGTNRARGSFVSDKIIQCVSPAWIPTTVTSGIARVPITIALNGLDFSNSSLSFQYYAPPVIRSISPSMVPVNASLSLSLYGNYLVSYGGVVCRIGPTLQVPGTVINGGRGVECDAATTNFTTGLVDAC